MTTQKIHSESCRRSYLKIQKKSKAFVACHATFDPQVESILGSYSQHSQNVVVKTIYIIGRKLC